MQREVVKDKLERIFREVFMDDELEIQNETTPNDIEDWDSMMSLNIFVSIEKEFKIKIKLDKMGTITNVGDIIDIICSENE